MNPQMNSFVPFHLKDSKPLNTLNNLNSFPRITIPNTAFPNQLEGAKLSTFFGLPGPYSPTNSDLRTASTNSVCLSPLSNYSPPKQSPPAVNPGLNNLLMTLKLQQNLQTKIFEAQMQQLVELKNSLLQKLNQQQEPTVSPVQNVQKQTVVVPAQEPQKQQEPVKIEANVTELPQRTGSKKGLKAQIKDIVLFVLDNFGRVSENRFDEERQKYSDNKDLMLVFDMLNAKYASTIKTKEEMVKYTLRRAFKFIKSNVKKSTQANSKGVSKTICNKYFKVSDEEFSKVANEEDFLKVVLPFRKNSKNKTMNTTFINEVFASEDFCRDYQAYLESFEGILEADNKNKIERLISFIEECLSKNKLGEIKAYKRIPWPKLWITNTKNIAQTLPTLGAQAQSPSDPKKKVKREGASEDDCGSEMSTDSHSTN